MSFSVSLYNTNVLSILTTRGTFTFALGNEQLLYVADTKLVKEINLSKTLDLGKPSYLQKDRGPLLGKGLITSNGAVWFHQRKTIAPQLFMDKVKVNFSLVECDLYSPEILKIIQ